MLAANLSSQQSLTEAVSQTFDGEHPCPLCKAIAAGKKSGKKSEAIAPVLKMEFPPVADWSGLPDRQFLQAELRHVLEHSIGALPENYKSVMLLRDVEELSTQETAGILDLTEDVVKTRLHRARLAVRRKIDEYLRVRPLGGG